MLKLLKAKRIKSRTLGTKIFHISFYLNGKCVCVCVSWGNNKLKFSNLSKYISIKFIKRQ